MDIQRISFASIKTISGNISEIIVDDGIEIDDAMVDELHDLLIKKYSGDFGLLVNIINSYAYTFAAQQRCATLDHLKVLAFVVYKRSTEVATAPIISRHRKRGKKVDLFYSYDDALNSLMADMADS
jgi:hypothetical protein